MITPVASLFSGASRRITFDDVKLSQFRIALGATPKNVVTVVLRDALVPLAAGLVVSIVAAIFLSRLLTGLLYEITATDPATYAAAALVLIAIGGVASARPAWRVATGKSGRANRSSRIGAR